MKSIKILLALLALVCVTALLASPSVLGASATYTLGSTKVTLNEADYGTGFTYFAPHSNETTAVAAAKAVAKQSGGRVFWLTHGDGARNVSFTLGGKKYVVDPNRIFSDAGAKASLKPYSPEAFTEVRKLADFITDHITKGLGMKRMVVGIHNNTNGNLSVVAYQKGEYAEAAGQIFQNPQRDPDDFFFVTVQDTFNQLKAKKFNVVRQSSHVGDDGSLSVYCQQYGYRYVNVEAQSGHLAQQEEMLKALAAL